MLRLHPRQLPSRRRVSLLAQPPARRRDSAEAEDRGRVLRLHQGHMQQRVRLTPLPQTPARSPEGSRATRHARETPADQKARTLFDDRRFFFFSAGPTRDATPSLVPPSSAHHHATDTTGTRAVSRTTRRRSRRSRNARRAEGARLRPRRCRSRFRSRRRSRRPLRAPPRSAPPGGRARPLTRSRPLTRNTRNTSDLPRTQRKTRTHRVVTSEPVRSRRRTRPRLRRARTRGPPSPPARRRSRRSRRCRAAPKRRPRRPRSGSAWRLRSVLLRSTRHSGTIAERIAQTSSGRRTRVSRRTCRVRTSRSARGRRRRRSRARVRPLSGSGPSPLRARATFAAAPSARPRPRRGGSGTAEHASRDPRDPRSIWGWGRPPRSRGGGWEVCSGGTPRPSSGTRSGRARRAPAPAPARRPCGAAAGSGPYAAASAGSARSTGGRAAGATEGPSLRRRERGIERDAGGGTRKVAIVTKNTTQKHTVIECASTLEIFTPSVRARLELRRRVAPGRRKVGGEKHSRALAPGVLAQQPRAGCCLHRRTRSSSDVDEGRARVRRRGGEREGVRRRSRPVGFRKPSGLSRRGDGRGRAR